MKLIELFSEMPYGAALNEETLRNRCSMCFATEAKIPCGGKCESVVYCNDACREKDRKLHEFECAGLMKNPQLDTFIRLLARIVTRRRIDQGIVHLCDKFPKNIEDRSLSDLMPHEREIERDKYRGANMAKIWKEYSRVFENTPLVDGWERFRNIYCIMMINCFSISGALDIKEGHQGWLGLGFYLNTSRFNHSCCPDLYVDFVGSLIVIRYPSTADNESAVVKERYKYNGSAAAMNQLTINYGYAHSTTSDSFFPLRQQRRVSLEYGYYFHCQCVLCANEREAMMEEHAAALECNHCGQPCVWKRKDLNKLKCCVWTEEKKYVCVKSCHCSWNADDADDAKMYARSLNPEHELPALEDEWSEVLAPHMKDVTATEIIEMCEPVLMKARYFWHRYDNLRMVQLNERCFVGYATAVIEALEGQQPVDRYVLKMALETGMVSIKWAARRPFNAAYHSIIAAYSYRLGRLYDVSSSLNSSPEHRKQAIECYLYAIGVWECLGDRAAEIMHKLRSFAQAEKPIMQVGL